MRTPSKWVGSRLRPDLEGAAVKLQQANFLEQNDSGWFLTAQALENLRFGHKVSNPRTFPQLADQPLHELSVCGLMLRAREAGWEWCKRPPSPKKAADLRYEVGGPLVWYSSGVSVPRQYLLCLLDAQRLKDELDVSFIPHCAPPEVYTLLLEGKPLQDALAIVNAKSQKRKSASQLALDVHLPEPERAAAPADS